MSLLKLLFQLGLAVRKVHGIYIFRQKHSLADLIQDNIEERKSAPCFIKKMQSNSIFGRFLMNANEYTQGIEMVTNREIFF